MIPVWVVACQKKFSYKRACFSAVVNIYIKKKNYAEGDVVPVLYSDSCFYGCITLW